VSIDILEQGQAESEIITSSKKTKVLKKTSKSQDVAYLDEAWKRVLRLYFKDFMELCWPEAYEIIDWTRGYECLEQELQPIFKKEEVGTRFADKIFKVYLKSGQEQWFFIHLEIQANWGSDFSERMFIYRYRIFEIYGKDVASLAILIDANKNWRPTAYESGMLGSKIRMEFPVLKLLDYRDKKESLEQSNNPFALVILAQLAALETAHSTDLRVAHKIGLTRKLYQKGYTADQIRDLYLFIDCIMRLPKPQKIQYTLEIKKIEEELKVAYVSSMEEFGIEQGIKQGVQQGIKQGVQQGIKQGESALLRHQMEFKFRHIPSFYLEKIQSADAVTLIEWGKRLLTAETIQEVFEAT